jgi:hypothetical protein
VRALRWDTRASRVDADLDKPHPTRGLSLRQRGHAAATNLMAGYI